MAEVAARVTTLYPDTHIEKTTGEVRVRIAPPKPVVLIGFLTVWFLGWTFGGMSALGGLVRGGLGVATVFLLVWLAGWLVGETIVGFLLAYLVGGEHLLTFTNSGLNRRQQAFKIGLTWDYAAENISKLAATTTGKPGYEQEALTFDYSGTPIVIKLGTRQRDAESIAAAVLEAFPKYR